MVLGERVRSWGKLGGGADGKLNFGRRVRKKGEDVTDGWSVVWKDILIKLSAGDAVKIARHTM